MSLFAPNTTLLLITRQVLARVDISGGRKPAVRRLWQRPRIESESTATLVDAAFRLGPRRAGRFWVLSSDVWIGVVSLPPDVANMLGGDELRQSVELEAETFSGLSAFDSRCGLRRLPSNEAGDARWWVVQIAGGELSAMEGAVRAAGGTWAGASHPALVTPPRGLATDDGSREAVPAWRVVQAWGETTLATGGLGEAVSDVTLLGGPIASSRTQTELLRWADEASAAAPLVWVADGELPIEVEADPQQVVRVDQEAGLGQWGTAWARDLASAEGLPVVRAEKRPMSNERATAVAAGLGLATLLLCGGHHWTVQGQIAAAEERGETLDAQKKRVADAEKQLAELRKANDKTKAEIAAIIDEADTIAGDLAAASRLRQFQRLRWLELVEALQQNSDGDNWIREIRGDSGHARVLGLALSTAAVNRLARALEAAANGRGWLVQPAQTKVTDQQLVEFEIRMTADDAARDDAQDFVSAPRTDEEVAP